MTAATSVGPGRDVQLRIRGLRIHAQIHGEGEPLVLVSTSFGGGAMLCNLEALWHFIHPRSYHPERLERVAGAMFGGRLRAEPELVRSMHIKRPTDTLAALYRMAGLVGWTSLPWLWAVGQPTLIVAGDDDPVTPLVNHRVIATLMPRARLHTMVGGGHLVLLDSAAQVGPVITGFLRDDHASDTRSAEPVIGQLATDSSQALGLVSRRAARQEPASKVAGGFACGSPPEDHERKVPMKIDCDCGNDTFQVSVNGHIHCTECHSTEGSDFRTESHPPRGISMRASATANP